MTTTPILRATDLRVGYRRGRHHRVVLDGLELELRGGEMVALLGRNGAGKSTLLRTLAGLAPSLGGRIELLGDELHGLSPRRRARRVGVVLPERATAGLLRVEEVVALGRHPHTSWSGRLSAADQGAVAAALERVDVAHLADRELLALSDGERQRVMIARALAQEPRLLVLDEPTAFLDLPGRFEILDLLASLAREPSRDGAPRAVLVASHDLDLVLATAGRIWLLASGGLIDGTPAQLVERGAFHAAFDSPAVRLYLDRIAGRSRP